MESGDVSRDSNARNSSSDMSLQRQGGGRKRREGEEGGRGGRKGEGGRRELVHIQRCSKPLTRSLWCLQLVLARVWSEDGSQCLPVGDSDTQSRHES